jgi:hypothetical protein
MWAALAVLILVLVMMFYPYNPYEIKASRVLTPEVKSGEHLLIEVDYCKYTSKTATVTRNLVDGYIYNITPFQSNLPKGCGTRSISIYITRNLPPGTYYLETLVEYDMNPLNKVIIESVTDYFKIVE